MEYVRSMDDLMLQINGAKPNEAVMKVFNILFPYDKPLPQGRGDELGDGSLESGGRGGRGCRHDPAQDTEHGRMPITRRQVPP